MDGRTGKSKNKDTITGAARIRAWQLKQVWVVPMGTQHTAEVGTHKKTLYFIVQLG